MTPIEDSAPLNCGCLDGLTLPCPVFGSQEAAILVRGTPYSIDLKGLLLLDQGGEFFQKLFFVLKVAVDRGKTDICYLVDLL